MWSFVARALVQGVPQTCNLAKETIPAARRGPPSCISSCSAYLHAAQLALKLQSPYRCRHMRKHMFCTVACLSHMSEPNVDWGEQFAGTPPVVAAWRTVHSGTVSPAPGAALRPFPCPARARLCLVCLCWRSCDSGERRRSGGRGAGSRHTAHCVQQASTLVCGGGGRAAALAGTNLMPRGIVHRLHCRR